MLTTEFKNVYFLTLGDLMETPNWDSFPSWDIINQEATEGDMLTDYVLSHFPNAGDVQQFLDNPFSLAVDPNNPFDDLGKAQGWDDTEYNTFKNNAEAEGIGLREAFRIMLWVDLLAYANERADSYRSDKTFLDDAGDDIGGNMAQQQPGATIQSTRNPKADEGYVMNSAFFHENIEALNAMLNKGPLLEGDTYVSGAELTKRKIRYWGGGNGVLFEGAPTANDPLAIATFSAYRDNQKGVPTRAPHPSGHIWLGRDYIQTARTPEIKGVAYFKVHYKGPISYAYLSRIVDGLKKKVEPMKVEVNKLTYEIVLQIGERVQ